METAMDVLDWEKELQHQLIDAGVKLLVPPDSIDDLLALLDTVEERLSMVGQDPSGYIQDGLLPAKMALISDKLFRHPNMDVKVSVLSCINEVLRITAPEQLYEDERMKEIFQLTLTALEKLSLFSGRCYSKALHILELMAMVRSSVILLDLGCDSLISQIFQLLLNIIGLNHPHTVFSNMEEIMTWLIAESDEISLDLLKPLLASVKKENQNISPLSWRLGEKVLKSCSAKVKPYLMKAVTAMRLDIDDYTDVVASLCRDLPAGENVVVEVAAIDAPHLGEATVGLRKLLLNDGTAKERNSDDHILEYGNPSKTLDCSGQIEKLKGIAKRSYHLEALKSGENLRSKAGVGAFWRRRGRKPISLVKREEVYERSGISGDKNYLELPQKRKNHGQLGSLPKNLSPKKSSLQSEPGKQNKPSSSPPRTSQFDSPSPSISVDITDEGRSLRRRDRPKEKESMVCQDVDVDVLDPKGGLLQCQLKGKSLQDSDSHLRTESHEMIDAEEKPGRGSRRKKSAVKNSNETATVLKKVVVKKENDILSDSEGKPLASLRQKNGKNGMKEKRTSEKKDAEESVEKGSKKPRVLQKYGEELVGSRIKVWWPMDREFYEGVIDSFDPSKKKHKVLYVDGDEEILNLKKERWFWLDDSCLDQDQKPKLPSSSVAPVKSRKKQANEKQDISVISEIRSKTQRRKRRRKSAEVSTVDTLRIKAELDALEKDEETLGSVAVDDVAGKCNVSSMSEL